MMSREEELVTRAVNGDRDAFNELYRRHRTEALLCAVRVLGNETDAEDAVQDAFVKVWQCLHKFRGQSSFKTWLLRVVTNTALTLPRRQRPRRAAEWTVAASQPIEEDHTQRDRLEEQRELVGRWLEEHATIQARFVWKLRAGGLTFTEIADRIKTMTPKAVSLILRRLNGKLQQQFGDQYAHSFDRPLPRVRCNNSHIWSTSPPGLKARA